MKYGTRHKINLGIRELRSWKLQKNTYELSCYKSPAISSSTSVLIISESYSNPPKTIKQGIQSLLQSLNFDSSHDLKLMNNILPVRILIQYRFALYIRQIFNYKKQAFQNISGNPLPTTNSYFHNWTRKSLLELNTLNRGWWIVVYMCQ